VVDHRLWSLDDEPAQVVDLTEIGALEYLLNYYGQKAKRVLGEILSQAYRAAAQTAVVEFRYIAGSRSGSIPRRCNAWWTSSRYSSDASCLHRGSDPTS
jgi:hypothetical protein